jgi:hypothetical protein
MNTSATGYEVEEYSDELGTLVFQSALMRYLSIQDSEGVATFEGYIDTHVTEENFLSDLCVEYPAFERILMEEMETLQAELQSVTTVA